MASTEEMLEHIAVRVDDIKNLAESIDGELYDISRKLSGIQDVLEKIASHKGTPTD